MTLIYLKKITPGAFKKLWHTNAPIHRCPAAKARQLLLSVLCEKILTIAQPAVGVVDDDAAGLHALRLSAPGALFRHAWCFGLVDWSAADERRLDPETCLAASRGRRPSRPRR